jgi:crossover junction endodeoxyribonuclease RuvC
VVFVISVGFVVIFLVMGAASRFRVLGIDPGLNITGYAAVDVVGREPVIVEAGTLRTNAQGDLAERIAQIHADLAEVLAELKPDLVAIEKLYAHYKHPRTSILMAHARGVILLAARQAGVAVRDLSATEVKKNLTGNGHASKQQVQRTIQSLCNLPELPQPPDVADAMAIALCAVRKLGP